MADVGYAKEQTTGYYEEKEKPGAKEVRRELESLEGIVSNLAESVHKLTESIDPVLGPNGPEIEGVDPAPLVETEIGKRLREIADRASNTLARVRNAQRRLQV